MTNPSPRQIEALKILRDQKPKTYAAFAELFWPDNLMHRRVTAAGNRGSRRGAGAWFSAGSYLGKLQKQGLVIKHRLNIAIDEWGIASLTGKGQDILNEYESSV